MKATRLLESQHRQVESMIRQAQTRKSEREQLTCEMATALAAHMLIEEEMFYPAAIAARVPAILQSYEEHEAAALVLRRLLMTRDDAAYDARLAVLVETLRGHVSEEENEIFPAMDRALGPQQSEMLGQQMEARFHQVLPMGYQAILAMRPAPADMAGRQGQQGQPCQQEQQGQQGQSGHQGQQGQSGHQGQQGQSGHQGQQGQSGHQGQQGQSGQQGQQGQQGQSGQQGQPQSESRRQARGPGRQGAGQPSKSDRGPTAHQAGQTPRKSSKGQGRAD
jgi:hemerythrin superfamily protein